MTAKKPKPTDPNDPNLPLERWAPFTRKLPWGTVKTGFSVDPDNPLLLVPDINHVFFLEQAFDHVANGVSLREAGEWVSQKIHRNVSHTTLNKLYNEYRKPYTFYKTAKRDGYKHSKEVKAVIVEKTRARAAVKRAVKAEEELKAKKLKKISEDKWEVPRDKPPVPESKAFEDTPDKTKITVAFTPTEKQKEFLRATEFEVLYGGAAGGGKSYAMIADPMRYFHNPNFNGLLLRRTNDELRELVRETQKMYPKVFVGANWQEQKSRWKFPSGAELWMSYLDRDDDVMRYVGQSFTWIGIDELTQYPSPHAYDILKSRLRTSDPELKKTLSMRATTNPGGPGHQWVKKRFVDPAVPGQPFWATDDNGEILRYPDNPEKYGEKAGQPLNTRIFIPAKLSDNHHLADDGIYEQNLLSLPEDQRRKLLDGDWSVMEGAAFAEWSPKDHVVPREEIPPDWIRFRAADFGYSSYSAVLWFAIEPGTGILHVYKELYVTRKTGADLADLVLEMESKERVHYGVLDSSVWHQRGHNGPSIAEEMIARGCRWRQADRTAGSRIAGKNRLHELLKIDPYTQRPGIVFHENCRQIIADLPMIPKDPDGGEDIDDKYIHDHTYDALRYGIMSRPKTNLWGEWYEDKKPQQKYRPVDPVFGY